MEKSVKVILKRPFLFGANYGKVDIYVNNSKVVSIYSQQQKTLNLPGGENELLLKSRYFSSKKFKFNLKKEDTLVIGAHKINYILPFFPAIALLIAFGFGSNSALSIVIVSSALLGLLIYFLPPVRNSYYHLKKTER